jgi:DNA repair protein RadC
VAGGGRTFFEQLEGLESSAEVYAAFEQYINRPIPLAPSECFAALYRVLVERLLKWTGLPAGPGAELREWRPLYQLAGEIDPYYFTHEQLERCLAACPPMSASHREEIVKVLSGYFALRREGFLPNLPSPIVEAGEGERWAALFPPRLAWESFEVLQAVGLYPVGSREGYRAFKRFEEGAFGAEAGPEGLRGWRLHCQDRRDSQEGHEKSAAHRRDFLAAAFAGRFKAIGLEGFCTPVPRCEPCPLQRDCRWAAHPTSDGASAPEMLGRLGQGRGSELGNAQLIQALFGLGDRAGQALAEKLSETPLRALAGKSAQELDEWLTGTGLASEHLFGVFELCRRYNEETLAAGAALVSAQSVFQHFRLRLRDFKQEQFLVVFLDAKRRFLGEVMVSQGTLSSSPVHPREVFSPAIRERAASVIVVHNHPSGDPTPSKDDIEITHRLVRAGETVGIPVLDHVIVAGDGYFSFVERDLM